MPALCEALLLSVQSGRSDELALCPFPGEQRVSSSPRPGETSPCTPANCPEGTSPRSGQPPTSASLDAQLGPNRRPLVVAPCKTVCWTDGELGRRPSTSTASPASSPPSSASSQSCPDFSGCLARQASLPVRAADTDK